MTTVDQLLSRIRRDYLAQGRTEMRARLDAPLDDTQTQITFVGDLSAIQPGALLSIGLEDIYVWSTDTTAKIAEVDRGVDGSTATAHLVTERVRIQPRWSDAQLLRAMNTELDNLYALGLYGIDTFEFDWTSATTGYELPATCTQVVKVWAQDYQGFDWIPLDGWAEEHHQNVVDFPSGVALFTRQPAIEGRKVRVMYRRAFAPLTALAADVTAVSLLPASAIDVLAMGTAITVLVGREVSQRLYETQGSTRRAEETPPGSASQSFTSIIRQYQVRLQAEKRSLARIHGLI